MTRQRSVTPGPEAEVQRAPWSPEDHHLRRRPGGDGYDRPNGARLADERDLVPGLCPAGAGPDAEDRRRRENGQPHSDVTS